jgi:hypothetical protein
MLEQEEFLSEIKSTFGTMSQSEIERLASDISEGRISYSKDATSEKINLVFKAGSQVPPTVIKGSLSVNLSPKQSDEASEASQQTLEPFSTIEGRDWMAERILDPNERNYKSPILLMGDGPFEARELAEFLHRFDISVYLENLAPPDSSSEENWEGWCCFGSIYTPVVVLGKQNFASKGLISLLLSKHIRDRGNYPPAIFRNWIERVEENEGRCHYLRSRSLATVTFISQEMLLAGIFTKGNGELNFGSAWQKHMEEHPALKAVHGIREDFKLLNETFQWPKTEAKPGEQPIGQTDWPQVGMLGFLGYSVGQNGELRTTRQRILRDLFYKVDLPKVENQAYVDEWGTPESGARLRKMAQSIAAFCRGARRRDEFALSVAIEEWEEDLAWLKTTYYDGKFDRQFQWPETI